MDPWLEHPALWPDVHNRFAAALGDELSPLVEPKYYVALERHVERARFHLRLRYDRPPEPPLRDEDAAWTCERVSAARA